MKSAALNPLLLMALISTLAACNNTTPSGADANPAPSGSIATDATPPVAEAMAEIDAAAIDPAATNPASTAMGDASMTNTDGTSTTGTMAVDPTVTGNAGTSALPARCDGLTGQAMTDCVRDQTLEARDSDNTTPVNPPNQ